MLSNKRSYKASVGTDKVHDLALLRLTRQPPAVTLADSGGLSVGQKVYAIGNPFGLSAPLTRASSAPSARSRLGGRADRRRYPDRRGYQPGNSGGPLLTRAARSSASNTMIASNGAEQSSGIGFAIPSTRQSGAGRSHPLRARQAAFAGCRLLCHWA